MRNEQRQKRPIESDSHGVALSAQLGSRRRGVLTLVVVLVGLWVLAGYLVLRAAKDMRIRLALERNVTIARLSARLIDEQADGALSTMRVFSQRFPLESALARQDKKELIRYLSTTVDLVPDLLGITAYRPDGSIVAHYCFPTQFPPPTESTYRPWLQTAGASGNPTASDVIRLPDASHTEAIALVFPIGKAGNKHAIHGYLVAYYRLFEIDQWLNRIRFGDESAVYVVNDQSHLVTSTNPRMHPPRDLSAYQPLSVARTSPESGSLIAADISGGAESTIGFAQAAVPHWTVLAIQPTEAAFAPTNYMVRRLSGLLIPILLAVLVSAWMLVTLYERQQELSLALAEHNEELRKADRVKSDFLANVSHDLRTPLASVQLSISGALETPGGGLPQDTRESLEMANEEIDHLTRRVRNLLDMSKLEAGVQSRPFEAADLTDIVAGALERLDPILKGRKVEADFPPEPLFTECDQSQMETVIMNLVENACKYSPEGSPVSLRGWSDRSEVHCSVSDQGAGVPASERERIFAKFYRAKQQQAVGGTGLGLAIAKAVVEAHGGSIGVRTSASGGSEFRFSLPRMGGAEHPEGQNGMRSRNGSGAGDDTGEWIGDSVTASGSDRTR